MSPSERVDEVEREYKHAKTCGSITRFTFWLTAALSLFLPFLYGRPREFSRDVLIVSAIVYFFASQFARFIFIPRAESVRRRQFLTDSLDAPLSLLQTLGYYNNEFSPSVARLGANVMENSLFTEAVATRMLRFWRPTIALYMIAWLGIFTARASSIELVAWATQVVFSAEVLVKWLRLEWLRVRSEVVFNRMHNHFALAKGGSAKNAMATIIDAAIEYESAKAAAGLLLSTKAFGQINEEVSAKWEGIRKQLAIGTLTNGK